MVKKSSVESIKPMNQFYSPSQRRGKLTRLRNLISKLQSYPNYPAHIIKEYQNLWIECNGLQDLFTDSLINATLEQVEQAVKSQTYRTLQETLNRSSIHDLFQQEYANQL